MKTWIRVALLGPLIACAAAEPPPNYATASRVAAPDISFASYHTFAFGIAEAPHPGYEVTERSLEVQRRLQLAVKAALERRGLTETTGHADLVVQLSTGSGSGFWLRPSAGDSELNRTGQGEPAPALGFIGINIYSGAAGTQVWQGSAFAEVDPMKIDDALLARGVEHMLQGFGSPKAESVAKAP